MDLQNNRIIRVLVLLCFLFLSIVVYLTYFELFQKDKVLTSSYNKRQWGQEDATLRGSILDRNGVVLAYSTDNEKKNKRVYPFGSLYSQLIGYNSSIYGKSLLEAQYNKELLNVREFAPILDIQQKLAGEQAIGNNLYLTLDHKLQMKAKKLLGSRNGAIVVMQPRTGEILAMVSKPDFNPSSEKLEQQWQDLIESKEHPFVPRATQGLYVPGSTFKVLIAAAAVESGMSDRTFNDEGSIVIEGKTIKNFGNHAYGTVDLKGALAVSSNVAFAQLGVDIGDYKLKDIMARAGMNKDIAFDVPVSTSRFPYKDISKLDLAAVGMGQGKLQVTPLHMAMIASGIANNGVIMKPYMVDRVVSATGNTLKTAKPSVFSKVMTTETAAAVKDMMQYVVEKGTGKSASVRGIEIAGKTGTAENELSMKVKNKEHAWFICFAPADDPQVAIAVVLEYSGSTGGKAAAPIARELIRQALR